MQGRTAWFEAIKGVFILATIFVSIFLSPCHSFEISPASVSPGQEVLLTGVAKPGSEISFQSSFTMNLPVTAGKYEYETTVEIPEKPNRFSVEARNVEDFNAGVKLGIWITKSFKAEGGTARITQRDVPPGRYSLKMFGTALPGSTEIPVTVEALTQVKADSTGEYNLAIDTSGIPAGDYRITGAGDSKIIRLGGDSSTTSFAGKAESRGSDGANEVESDKVGSGQTTKPAEVNQKMVHWYARQMGLNIENSSQYDSAEKLLNKRLSGGYWKLISQGQPLTEAAGDCQEEYCLVRGIDACTVCREKDTILRRGSSSNNSSINATLHPALRSNLSPSQQAPENVSVKSFVSILLDWIRQLLGFGPGG